MREYGLSLTRVLPYKDKILDFLLIRENTGQWKPVFLHILYSESAQITHTYSGGWSFLEWILISAFCHFGLKFFDCLGSFWIQKLFFEL